MSFALGGAMEILFCALNDYCKRNKKIVMKHPTRLTEMVCIHASGERPITSKFILTLLYLFCGLSCEILLN